MTKIKMKLLKLFGTFLTMEYCHASGKPKLSSALASGQNNGWNSKPTGGTNPSCPPLDGPERPPIQIPNEPPNRIPAGPPLGNDCVLL